MILVKIGLPASGKTTEALALVAEDPSNRLRINYDDLRVELFGCKGEPYFTGKQTDIKLKELKVKAIAKGRAKDFLLANPLEHSVVVDNTNLTTGARAPWENLAKEVGVAYQTEEMSTPVAECVRRDALRMGQDRVGRAVIERMSLTTGWYDWEVDFPRQRHSPRDFVIVDIDGTLSDPTHRLHHIKDRDISIHRPNCDACPADGVCAECGCKVVKFRPKWDLFHAEVDKDPCHTEIRDLVRDLKQVGYHIFVVSGRSPEHGCGLKTEAWLEQHGVPFEALWMRAAGDYKPDYLHKTEILEHLPKERIAFVLDDRQQCVEKTWRAAGVRCLQVAAGNF